MALKKATSKKASAEQSAVKRTAVARKTTRQAAPRAEKGAAMSDSQKRAKLLKERFCPEGVSWLKDVLGIDLQRVPLQAVYDIAVGNVTSEPLEAVVTPLAYDKVKKSNVEMPPVKVVASFRIVMPYDRESHRPIAPSKEHPVFVASFPCYEMLDKSEPEQQVVTRPAAAEGEEMPKFTPEAVMALEGIGIREDRLYANSFNAVSLADKRAMVNGDAFDCTGTIRVADGLDNRVSLNLNGLAKLVSDKEGHIVAQFQPQYPVEQRKGKVIDLTKVCRIANVEIDIYDRDARGMRKTDVYGNPLINKAGKDLVQYGRVFGCVDGYVHSKEFKGGKFEEHIEKNKYEVSVVNGGLCITSMKKVFELGPDGEQRDDKYHYESRDAKVNKDGTVRVGMQDLKPATPKDLVDYRRGVGGKFIGFETKDFKTGKSIVYDAYVVPDNRRNGYGRAFSQKASEDLLARREEKKAARRQNYSMGL